jgi:hypothetical protein
VPTRNHVAAAVALLALAAALPACGGGGGGARGACPVTAQVAGGLPPGLDPAYYRVPHVEAETDEGTSGIYGVLAYGGGSLSPAGSAVTWVVDARRAGPQLKVLGTPEEGSGSYRQAFPATGPAGEPGAFARFDSTLRLPAGCWDLDLSSGTARGTVVFESG